MEKKIEPSRVMMRKSCWLVFGLVFAWKIALFVFTMQPVPANDAFFYDGAVVHHLLHGGYYNPCIKIAFPISGEKVFSAYPPLYQFPLLGWMSVFGTSAPSAMAFHIFLFGLYLLVLLAILLRLKVPAWCINLTGGFLLVFTFHDRPDSLAHLLGMLAIYAWVRSHNADRKWTWLMVVLIILTFCTSLQIGGIYFLVVSLAAVMKCRWEKKPLPWAEIAFMAIMPVILVLLVKSSLPEAWAGFMENVRQTPFITGMRIPHIGEILKIARTVPGVFVVAAMLGWQGLTKRIDFSSEIARGCAVVLVATLLPALGLLVGCVTIIAPNTVAIAGYLQPLIVASYLGLLASNLKTCNPRASVSSFVAAILLVSVRAIGMTIWGVICATDVSYPSATVNVWNELATLPKGSTVVMSSAFLYAAADNSDIELIHSDWMARAGGNSRVSDKQGLLALKPQKMILTQFDYYRRFQPLLESLRREGLQIQTDNLARIKPPDAYKSLQQVVQHISWAPVIVTFSWAKTE